MSAAWVPRAHTDTMGTAPVAVAVWRLARRVRTNAERVVLAGTGLTLPDYAVLQLIRTRPDVRVAEVCRQVAVAKATLSDILAKLIRRGFISRRRPPADRRTVVLACTPAGAAMVQTLNAAMRAAGASLVNGDEELLELCAVLARRLDDAESVA
ncbi:MarR family winged helix-turn-helix transcriptional regulator [Dactylosporangium sp. NPDC005572]|uniref:MarR family winged helix-turn-helix transcriptional regulator n=1 Tax=Dactylosporangium sp. NPDC005572 TaxID=3156889 RepID=UPI0033A0BBFC